MNPVVIVCCALFCLGLYGVLVRRDIIGVLASVEVMLGSANVLLVALSRLSAAAVRGTAQNTEAVGLVLVVVAAAEAAVGLALLVAAVRRTGRSRIDELAEVEG